MPKLKTKKVLLKPNMLLGKGIDAAITTHPAIVENVIKVLLEKKAKLFLGDSPGIPINPKIVAKQVGILDVVDQYHIEFVDFTKSPVEITRKENKLVKTFTLAGIINEVDYIINLPKLKTHVHSIFTGSIKNLFGFVPGLLKPQFHVKFSEPVHFAQMIVDLAMIIKPQFTIMDGIVAMEGEGPSNGQPKKLGVLIASSDMVAIDSAACHLIGLNPHHIPIIQQANQDGLGEIDLGKISIQGGRDLNVLKDKHFKTIPALPEMNFKKVNPVKVLAKHLFTAKPVIKEKKCIKCHICINVCPVKALSAGKGNIPAYNYHSCIRCYCCHEMCPEGAIFKKSNFITKLIFGS